MTVHLSHYFENIIPMLLGLYFYCSKTHCLSYCIMDNVAFLFGYFLNVFFVCLPTVSLHMSECGLIFANPTQDMLHFLILAIMSLILYENVSVIIFQIFPAISFSISFNPSFIISIHLSLSIY